MEAGETGEVGDAEAESAKGLTKEESPVTDTMKKIRIESWIGSTTLLRIDHEITHIYTCTKGSCPWR
jgi:hypothetical protein